MGKGLGMDKNLSKLVQDMGDTYSVVNRVLDSDGIGRAGDLITCLLKQTIECVALIREYSGGGFGGKLWIYEIEHALNLAQDRKMHILLLKTR